MAIEVCEAGCKRDSDSCYGLGHARLSKGYAKQASYNRSMRKMLGYPELSAGPGFKKISVKVKSYDAWRRKTLGYAFAEACQRPVPRGWRTSSD